LERDEGEYGYIARRWLDGEVPYKSAFDQKPPGVFAAYAIILSVFGASPEAIRWGAQIYTLCTLGLIYLAGRRLFGAIAGLTAVVLAAYMTADRCVLGNAANTELFMILPLTAGFLAADRATDRGSAGWAAAAGFCGAVALLFKQVALSNVALYGLMQLGATRHRFRLLAVFVLATVAVLAGVAVYFAAAGVRDEFLDCVLIHNLGYANQVAWYDYPREFLKTFQYIALQWWPILLLAAAGGLPRARATTVWGPRWLAGTWLLASCAGVAVGGYFRAHYFVQLIPPLAVLAGRGASIVAKKLLPSRPEVASYAVALVAIAYGILVMPEYWLTGTPAEKSRLLYDIAPFPEAVPVGDYLRRQTVLGDSIFVCGNEPEIYYYSGRRTACRYIFLYPLLTPATDAGDRQHAALAELMGNRPRFVVVHRDVSPPVGGSPPKDFEVAVKALLDREYRLVGGIDPEDTTVRMVDLAGSVADPLRPEWTLTVWQRKER
jgi:4-amino-4-deoxy-L-arabinose transferase-like glycosyltransferase